MTVQNLKLWLVLVLVGFVSLQFSDIWRVEGSLADLTQPHKRKATDSYVVGKENVLDLEAFKSNDYTVRGFVAETSPESSSEKIPESSADENQDDEQEAEVRKGFLSQLKTYATTVVAPVQSYTELALRFKRWHEAYRRAQDKFGIDEATGAPKLADPMNVLREEYAKVDKILADEMCEKGEMEAKFENVEFIVKILKLMIERLEMKLDEIEMYGLESGEANDEDPLVSERLEEIEYDAEEAIQRAKRIAARSAIDFVQNEVFVVVKMMAFDLALGYMISNGLLGAGETVGMMSKLDPIVSWMGAANTPLLISYFQNVRFRSIFALVNHSFSSLKCLVPRKRQRLSKAAKIDRR